MSPRRRVEAVPVDVQKLIEKAERNEALAEEYDEWNVKAVREGLTPSDGSAAAGRRRTAAMYRRMAEEGMKQ